MSKTKQTGKAGYVQLDTNDWSELYPEKPFTIGKKTLTLKALTLDELPQFTVAFMDIWDHVAVLKLTEERFMEQLPKLVKVIATKSPPLVSLMSKIREDDVKRLPLVTSLSLTSACLALNLQSPEDLLKNLLALADQGNALKVMLSQMNLSASTSES